MTIKTDWKENEMCFFEFKLSEIKKLDENQVEISDGYFRIHSNKEDAFPRCFPVTLNIKTISEIYSIDSDKIHKEGLPGLNYPDIHRWLVQHWSITCQKPDNIEFIRKRYDELEKFTDEIFEKVKEIQMFKTSYGFYLMRQ